jgi:hypothetical protein
MQNPPHLLPDCFHQDCMSILATYFFSLHVRLIRKNFFSFKYSSHTNLNKNKHPYSTLSADERPIRENCL